MISTSGHLISNFPEVRFHRTRIFNLVDEYGNRPDHQGFFQYLNSATDIEKAKQTVNITLYELNVNRIEEIKSSSFFWIERTVDSTVESTLTCVEKHLGLI